MIGKTISHYKILEKLGEGGMGVVYKAEDTKLKRPVALKFLPRGLEAHEPEQARFLQEAQAASTLNHPNICTIYAIEECEHQQFIVMELIDGVTLRSKIHDAGCKMQDVLTYAIQIGEALQEAHSKEIVHRDVKPENIMINSKNQVKVMDFGLAKLRGVTKVTKEGTTLGTVAYMSPEQARGEVIDYRTDIWSLGIVLYEMITGQSPFKSEYEQAVVYAILNEEPKSMMESRAEIPPELQQIVEKTLVKNRDSRYQNAADILTDLRKLKKELESIISKEQPSTKKPQPSIAVLPFTNLSVDKEQEYFCDGMAEEIINALSQVEGLHVVARTSAFFFRGKEMDIREIGRKLGVGAVLEGSVRKAGNRIRITAQLINIADGYHLWSEKFDREMQDIFSIQDEISQAIVAKLKVKLLGEEKRELVRSYTEDVEAYNLYLKGRYFWNKRTEMDLKKAIEYFEQAIERDNNYAPAYAGIADSYNHLPDYSSCPPDQTYPKGKEAALMALKLDNTLAEAHASLGLLKTEHEWDWLGAEKEFKQAIGLNPACVTAHYWYGLLLGYLGRFDEAIGEVRKALELDPLSVLVHKHMAQVLLLAGKPGEAIDILQKGMEIEPNSIFLHAMIGLAYSQKSLYEEALAELLKEKKIFVNSPPVIDAWIGGTYAVMGRKDKVQEILNDLLTRSESEYIPPSWLARLYFALGEKEEGFKWLEKAYEKKDTWLRYLRVYRFENFSSVSSDPRFIALMKKMGLEK